MTLKDILEKRRLASAQEASAKDGEEPKRAEEGFIYKPMSICPELDAYHALFAGCEDF